MKRYAPIVFVLLVGGTISLVANEALRKWEDDRAARGFQLIASNNAGSLRQSIGSSISAVDSIGSFYGASAEVTRAEFSAFTREELRNHHNIQALEWIPRVTAAERSDFEAAARADGFSGFKFTKRESQGRMVPAAAREEYFPVFFVEPLTGNEAALGFDLGSSPARMAALEQARDSGEAVATARITLVQETGDQYGFLYFAPIYRKKAPIGTVAERRVALEGFGLGVLRVGEIISTLTEDEKADPVAEIFVFDTSASAGQQLLYPKSAAIEDRAELNIAGCVDNFLQVGGRDWLLVNCPVGQTAVTGRWQSSTALIAGLAVTGIMALYLLLVLRQRRRLDQMANSLRASEKSYRAISLERTQLIASANAPIFGIDTEGRVNEWNEKATSITGSTRDDVIGRDLVANFVTDEYKVSAKQVLDKALGGNETSNYEFPIYTKAGDRIDLLLNLTARRDADGKIIGAVGIGQDITELKKAQIQVIQASKLATLGEMSTGLAHELNQPLSTIEMAANNIATKIKMGTADPDYTLSKIERIQGQVQRASSIIDHMRVFGRTANDKLETFDVRDVMRSALGLIGEQLRLAAIEVTTSCKHECPFILGYKVQLEQVFLNILVNAHDALIENDDNTARKIVVEGTPIDDDTLKISFTDTGGGISEDKLTRIFEPFFTTKEIGKGTGLGLSISYGIIHDMGGTMSVKNVDSGACFEIALPIA